MTALRGRLDSSVEGELGGSMRGKRPGNTLYVVRVLGNKLRKGYSRVISRIMCRLVPRPLDINKVSSGLHSSPDELEFLVELHLQSHKGLVHLQ